MFHTPPSPQVVALHRRLVAYTLCRKCVGDIEFAEAAEAPLRIFQWLPEREREVVEDLLHYANAHWRRPSIGHHCCAGCRCGGDIDGARKAMFSVLLRAGAVLGSDVRLPSAKDWGTCTGMAAQEVIFILLHNVLPRAVWTVFATWSLAGADVAEPGNGQDDDYRQYIRSKTGRTKQVLRGELRG